MKPFKQFILESVTIDNIKEGDYVILRSDILNRTPWGAKMGETYDHYKSDLPPYVEIKNKVVKVLKYPFDLARSCQKDSNNVLVDYRLKGFYVNITHIDFDKTSKYTQEELKEQKYIEDITEL